MTDPRITEITAQSKAATYLGGEMQELADSTLYLIERLATAEKQIADARRILSLRIDKHECRFDHNHSCQTHSDFYIPQGEKCIDRQAKDWLAALTAQDKETPSTSLEAAFFPGLSDQLDALTIRKVDQ